MHFHPFGIPVDEFIVVTVTALQAPPSYYLGVARQLLGRVRARLGLTHG